MLPGASVTLRNLGTNAASEVTTGADGRFSFPEQPIGRYQLTVVLQGFQTVERRLRDPNAEQDMPALYLVELNEVHGYRESTRAMLVELNCEAWIFTRVGADQNAVPAGMLNILIDAVERALSAGPERFRQNLGLEGVLYCRIEGELQKDPGHSAQTAMAVIPIKIAAAQHIDNVPV